MTWRGQSSPPDRIFSALVYLLPIIRALPFGLTLLGAIPVLGQVLFLAIGPFLTLYAFLSGTIPFFDLIVFFALYLGVVRNSRFSYFLRYNVMQALLIGFAVSIVAILTGILGLAGGGLIVQTLYTATFIAALGASTYSLVRSATGTFPELPVISDAAYQYIGR
ncbi:MAG: Tic20 family protein [Geitlerinemataceae cyanobacterium]